LRCVALREADVLAVDEYVDVAAEVALVVEYALPDSRIVAVVGSDIWPLPWYLRRCPQVGYWPELPGAPAPFLVVSSAGQAERVARALGPGWTPELYGLRSEVLAVLFIPPAPARLGGARGP